MSIESTISDLLADAEPLRLLDDDDPAKVRLTHIVDEINRLRAIQAKAQAEGHEAEFAAIVEAVNPKRGPGRPKKVAE